MWGPMMNEPSVSGAIRSACSWLLPAYQVAVTCPPPTVRIGSPAVGPVGVEGGGNPGEIGEGIRVKAGHGLGTTLWEVASTISPWARAHRRRRETVDRGGPCDQ
jgi:hypothetical protein